MWCFKYLFPSNAWIATQKFFFIVTWKIKWKCEIIIKKIHINNSKLFFLSWLWELNDFSNTAVAENRPLLKILFLQQFLRRRLKNFYERLNYEEPSSLEDGFLIFTLDRSWKNSKHDNRGVCGKSMWHGSFSLLAVLRVTFSKKTKKPFLDIWSRGVFVQVCIVFRLTRRSRTPYS